MNAKAKGARAERRARRMLELQGWTVVRAAGSLGPFDLVAFNRERLRLIQVKTNRGPSEEEWEALSDFNCCPPITRREIWLFRDGVAQPEVIIL